MTLGQYIRGGLRSAVTAWRVGAHPVTWMLQDDGTLLCGAHGAVIEVEGDYVDAMRGVESWAGVAQGEHLVSLREWLRHG